MLLIGAAVQESPMVAIPGATFEMGTDAADLPRLQEKFGLSRRMFEAEMPRHRVSLSPYSIDAREVTNAEFKVFVDTYPQWRRDRIEARLHNGKYLSHWVGGTYPKGSGDKPVSNVSWYAAAAYCRCQGKRLPTEAEWEHAARGGLQGKDYPWGDQPADAARANFAATGVGGTSVAGRFAPNGYGLYDVAGNLWEYTLDEWGSYAATPQTDPVEGGIPATEAAYLEVKTRRVIRGGSWQGSPVNLRVAYRDSHPPEGAGDHVGFRCAKPR